MTRITTMSEMLHERNEAFRRIEELEEKLQWAKETNKAYDRAKAQLQAENKELEREQKELVYDCRDHRIEKEALRDENKALREAVKALPVEEMVDEDSFYGPELVGYCMQCQGEWSRVLELLEESE